MFVLRLKEKDTGKTVEGRQLIDVDNKLCEYLGIEPDKVEFHRKWIDRIGFGLAVGSTMKQCRNSFKDPEDQKIMDFLEKHYEPDCYFTRMK